MLRWVFAPFFGSLSILVRVPTLSNVRKRKYWTLLLEIAAVIAWVYYCTTGEFDEGSEKIRCFGSKTDGLYHRLNEWRTIPKRPTGNLLDNSGPFWHIEFDPHPSKINRTQFFLSEMVGWLWFVVCWFPVNFFSNTRNQKWNSKAASRPWSSSRWSLWTSCTPVPMAEDVESSQLLEPRCLMLCQSNSWFKRELFLF